MVHDPIACDESWSCTMTWARRQRALGLPAMTVWNSNRLASMTEVIDRWHRMPHSSNVPFWSCNSCSKGFTASTISMLHTVMTMKHKRKDQSKVLAQVAIIVASLLSSRKVRSFLKNRVNRRILPSRSARTTLSLLSGSFPTTAVTTISVNPHIMTRPSRTTDQSVKVRRPSTTRTRRNSAV